MRAVLHGDRVAVQTTGTTRDGKTTGEIVSIPQRANHRVVGSCAARMVCVPRRLGAPDQSGHRYPAQQAGARPR